MASLQHPIFYAVIMLIAGIGIPIGATLNALLGEKLQSPVLAAAIFFAIAFLVSLMILLIVEGAPKSLSDFASASGSIPVHAYMGGLFILFYVLNVTWVAPAFGVGNAIAFVLLGQIISMAVIDHYSLFGATQHLMTLQRFAGLVLMAVGVFLAVRRQ